MKTFTISQLAQELGLHPKRARAILRKSGKVREGTRWTFPSDQKSELKSILKVATKPAKKQLTPKRKQRKEPIAADEHPTLM